MSRFNKLPFCKQMQAWIHLMASSDNMCLQCFQPLLPSIICNIANSIKPEYTWEYFFPLPRTNRYSASKFELAFQRHSCSFPLSFRASLKGKWKAVNIKESHIRVAQSWAVLLPQHLQWVLQTCRLTSKRRCCGGLHHPISAAGGALAVLERRRRHSWEEDTSGQGREQNGEGLARARVGQAEASSTESYRLCRRKSPTRGFSSLHL